jgi:hypothetical protein
VARQVALFRRKLSLRCLSNRYTPWVVCRSGKYQRRKVRVRQAAISVSVRANNHRLVKNSRGTECASSSVRREIVGVYVGVARLGLQLPGRLAVWAKAVHAQLYARLAGDA